MRPRLTPEADDELSEATAYFSRQSALVAQRFLADIDDTVQLLLQFPGLGSPLPKQLRRLLLKVFPYRIIYRLEGNEIVVYAIAHVRRKPGYWRKRVPK
jgi:plasmid stabilization system protein ParE